MEVIHPNVLMLLLPVRCFATFLIRSVHGLKVAWQICHNNDDASFSSRTVKIN